MRAALAALALLATGCAPQSQSGVNIIGPRIVCQATLNFGTEEARAAFLAAHAEAILAGTDAHNLFLAPALDTPRIDIIANEACSGGLLPAGAGLRPAASVLVDARSVPFDDAERFVVSVLTPSATITHETSFQCVARTHDEDMEAWGVLASMLRPAGLRRINVPSADGMTYIAADESCATLAVFVEAAAARRGLTIEVHSCGPSSLRACGFAHGLEIGPHIGAP